MPHAASIPAVSNPIAPVLKSMQGTATASSDAASQPFRELFREKTRSIEIPVAKTAQGAAKSAEKNGTLVPGPERVASEDQAGKQSRIGLPPSGSFGSIAQIASQTSLASPLHTINTTEADVSAPSAYSAAAEPETALSVRSKQIQSTLVVTSQEKTERKIRKPGYPEAQSGAQNFVIGTPLPTSAPFISAAPASSATSSAAEEKSAPSHANLSTASLQSSNGDILSSATDHIAAPQQASSRPASSNATPSANLNPDSKNTAGESATGTADESVSVKASGPSNSALPAASGSLAHVGHALHASTEPASSGAPAVFASGAALAGVHSGADALTPLSAMPRGEQAVPVTAAVNTATPATAPYDKIDQEAAPAVLHAGAQQVAVGVRDPNLGWVEIKTQNVAGHIDATLVTASQQTHTSLAAQIPAMAEYLRQSDVRVGTLAVHQQMPGTNSGTNSGNAFGNGSGNGQSSGSSGSNPQNSHQPEFTARYTGISPGLLSFQSEGLESFGPVSYISVRA